MSQGVSYSEMSGIAPTHSPVMDAGFREDGGWNDFQLLQLPKSCFITAGSNSQ